MLQVLVVDDDEILRISVKNTLVRSGRFNIQEAYDGLDAIEKIKQNVFDMVILDIDMPRMNGLQALQQIKANSPSIIVLILTAYANIEDAVKSVKEGAYNYIVKPIKGDHLIQLVDKAIQAHMMISHIAASSPILMESGRKIIGNTEQMQKVFNIVHRLSKVDTPVLIRGASGTGKELVARAIHFNSVRKDHRFVAVNCSAIPENLFESEFFGHEKGSFTGADSRKIGKFQYAEGGTLFLDEVGDLSLSMQIKLLRVLQEKFFTPVGSNREIDGDVRIIAATHRPLEKMIELGTFREDFFYRLNVMPIFLPFLKERDNDMGHLIQFFISKFNKEHMRSILGVSPEVKSVFLKYEWPGNIRELENVIEHAFIMENTNILQLASLPESILNVVGASSGVRFAESLIDSHLSFSVNTELDVTINTTVDEAASIVTENHDVAASNFALDISEPLDFSKYKETFEKEFIIKALKTFKGKINHTALHANIPKKTLLRKIEKYDINIKDYQ